MLNKTKQLGNWGESLIAKFLEEQKFVILERNYQTRWGEIDLIAKKGDIIAFVEVKTRKVSYFPISNTITQSKQRKLIRTAQLYAQKKNLLEYVLRFDVATITMQHNSHNITYLPNAFQKQ